jgi:hypothetical protein
MTITLAEFAIGFAYGALLEGFWNGQTIGKRLFHLRVIDQSGLPLRIEQAWVRNLMRVFDALPFAYLVGGISVLSSPIMQRFGDRWSCGKRRSPPQRTKPGIIRNTTRSRCIPRSRCVFAARQRRNWRASFKMHCAAATNWHPTHGVRFIANWQDTCRPK